MKSMINVGNETNQSPVTITNIANAVCDILKVGAETRTEQATIREALGVISKMASISGVTITNSSFINHPTPQVATPTQGDGNNQDDEDLE